MIKILTFCATLGLYCSNIFAMGSTPAEENEPTKLRADQPNYSATAIYEDGHKVEIEGIHLGGKARISRGIWLKKGSRTIKASVFFKNVKTIEVNGKEGPQIKIKIFFNSGKKEDYLLDAKTKFEGSIKGSEGSSLVQIKASEISRLEIHGPTKSREKNRKKTADCDGSTACPLCSEHND